MGAAVSDGIVAFASIIGAVCGDAADRLVRRDLVQKIWQHRRITDVAPGDLHGPNLQRLFVDPKMYLAPNPPLGPTMLACVPLSFTLDLDTGAVHCPAGHHEVMSREGISRCNGS